MSDNTIDLNLNGVHAVSATFTSYIDGESPPVPAKFDAYIPVRVPVAPRPDGYVEVYLPDGTGFAVNSRHLLRLAPEQSGHQQHPREGAVRP